MARPQRPLKIRIELPTSKTLVYYMFFTTLLYYEHRRSDVYMEGEVARPFRDIRTCFATLWMLAGLAQVDAPLTPPKTHP